MGDPYLMDRMCKEFWIAFKQNVTFSVGHGLSLSDA